MTETNPRKSIFKKNIVFASRWFGMIFVIIFLWILALQVFQLGHFSDMGSGRETTNVIKHKRGRILDRNGKTLAIDDVSVSVYCDPVMAVFPGEPKAENILDTNATYNTQNSAIDFIVKNLAPLMEWNENDLFKEITRVPEFVWIKRRDITPEAVATIKSYSLPGIKVAPDGRKYFIEFDILNFKYADGIVDSIGEVLGMAPSAIEKELSVIPEKRNELQRKIKKNPELLKQNKTVAMLRLSETATTIERKRIEDLRINGIRFVDAGQNISIGCYTKAFRGITPLANIEDTVAMLSPILNMKPDKLKRAMQGKLRYVSIRKNLSINQYKKFSEMQATLYVVRPGKLLEVNEETKGTPQERIQKAAERIYRLIHNLKRDEPLQPRAGKTEMVSMEKIITSLTSGPAGKLVIAGDKAKNSEIILPIKKIILSLENKPIPGVVYGLPGVKTEEKMVREYPYNAVLSQTLGYMEQTS